MDGRKVCEGKEVLEYILVHKRKFFILDIKS